jgi:hypothetical protein
VSLLPVHVIGGVIAIATGLVALYAFKGGPLHRRSGLVFVYAMLVMSLTGAAAAIGRPGATMNLPAGLITAYLVITSLATVRPASPRRDRIERAAMIVAFALGTASLLAAFVQGVQRRPQFAFPLVMFAALALGAGRGDLRMIRAGGIRGKERIRRHLWRMSTALFIAAGSFFLGPTRRIPEPLQGPLFRALPLIVLVTMGYWLWRYRRQRPSSPVVSVNATEALQ